MTDDDVLLRVNNLVTTFQTEKGKIRPVDGLSFEVKRGKTLAIVGESGSGKSVTSLSIMRLIPESNGAIENGEVWFEGEDVLKRSPKEMRSLRGNRMAMIFQEPMTALNPVYTIGQQMREVYDLHQNISRSEARSRSVEMLQKVRISDPSQVLDKYPHQLSGGMRQRVMIAMALACNPSLLIADEPTTALDVTIQAQVLRLMRQLQEELGTAIIFITHDLGVVAQVADEVMVMYTGRVVERGTVHDIFERPTHPYTQGLLGSLPSLEDDRDRGELTTIKGVVPSLWELPAGCRFAGRCPKALDSCHKPPVPELIPINGVHAAACPVVLDDDAS
ncbi:MAG: dipeptide ABC transporter ATP-binding protein DppD [Myxococcales bacterium]|nr:dipeptide ABC transporter ATP-binding protein DppD [Myxococcales bacterium]